LSGNKNRTIRTGYSAVPDHFLHIDQSLIILYLI
jgi:hypothetical protein